MTEHDTHLRDVILRCLNQELQSRGGQREEILRRYACRYEASARAMPDNNNFQICIQICRSLMNREPA